MVRGGRFGPVWKAGLKSHGTAGNILAWGVVVQIWRGGILPGVCLIC